MRSGDYGHAIKIIIFSHLRSLNECNHGLLNVYLEVRGVTDMNSCQVAALLNTRFKSEQSISFVRLNECCFTFLYTRKFDFFQRTLMWFFITWKLCVRTRAFVVPNVRICIFVSIYLAFVTKTIQLLIKDIYIYAKRKYLLWMNEHYSGYYFVSIKNNYTS